MYQFCRSKEGGGEKDEIVVEEWFLSHSGVPAV